MTPPPRPRPDDEALAELVGQLADEFTDRLQRGEQPDIEEFAGRHPAIADVVRQVLPALQVIPRAADTARAFATPTVLGDYRIVRELGRGGMGVVYEAEQISFKRRVALKVLPINPALDTGQLARFQREANTAAQLHHTNIVPVYAVGCEQGVHYYAMQLIDGQGLDKCLVAMRARLPSPLEGEGSPSYYLTVARIGAQVADALEYAHQRKVVHRDIKPSNLILDAGGTVWITDFGLVKSLDDDSNLTQTGDVLGTARYMSPEQALGRRAAIDRRSDVYSLGATLYELLTLRPVFTAADNPTILQQIAFEEPPAPRSINDAVPRNLETIVLKALAKDPRGRYASAADLAADLRRFLAGGPIIARPENSLVRLTRWAKRRPALAALLVVSSLAVLAFVIQVTWSNAELRAANQRERQRAGEAEGANRQAQLRAREAEEAKQREGQRAQEAEQRERIGRRHLYAVQMNLVHQAWERGHVARVRALLEGLLPGPRQEDLRGFEWFYYWRLAHRDRSTLAGHAHVVSAVAADPAGKLLATGSHDGTIKIWWSGSETLLDTLRLPRGRVTALAWTTSGVLLAASHEGAIVGWSVAGARKGLATPALRLQAPSGVTALAARSDAQTLLLVAGCMDGTVRLYDGVTLREQAVLVGHSDAVLAVALTADGECVASGSADHSVRLWDIPTCQMRDTLHGHIGPVRAVAFSPDDTLLASGGDETIRLWQTVNGKERAVLQGHADWVTGVSFAPDGESLASVGGAAPNPLWPGELKAITVRAKPGEVKLWNVVTHMERATLKGHAGPVGCVAFAPDGRTLVTGSDDASAIVWDVAGAEQATLPGHTLEINSLAFAPDGKTLATVSDDRHLKLWDIATGREVVSVVHPKSNLKFVVYAPDGNVLAMGGGDHVVKLWDVATRQEAATLRGHKQTVRSFAFSPDGQTLATGAGDPSTVKPRPGEIKLWDLATRQPRLDLPGHTQAVRSVAFAPDGKLLASGSDDRTTKLWDVGTGKEVATLSGHGDWVRYVAFSNDGKTLATASNDSTVKLWDVATRTERAVLRGHRAAVLIVVFAPDGQTIATGSSDGSVKLWDVVTGQERAVLEGHRGSIRAVGFRPDGRILATGDNEPRVKLWYATEDR